MFCQQQLSPMWKKISQAHNLMPAFSEEEQDYDKPVSIQPLAIIWQPFLACTLSVLLTPGHWGQLNRLASPLLRDPVTCWKRQTVQKQLDVMLLWACFGLSKSQIQHKLLPVAVVVKFVITGKCNKHPKSCSK